jgi:hypothetical protein
LRKWGCWGWAALEWCAKKQKKATISAGARAALCVGEGRADGFGTERRAFSLAAEPAQASYHGHLHAG